MDDAIARIIFVNKHGKGLVGQRGAALMWDEWIARHDETVRAEERVKLEESE